MSQRRIKVGVIGSGAISGIYLENMVERFDNLEVLAVASKHPENARKKAEKYGIRAVTVGELLADPEVELVVNLTPLGAHYELIKRALLAGKHVYTEKTMTATLPEARELMELAEERGLYLGSAPDTFLGSALQAARAAIDDGLLGEVNSFAISANRNNDILLSLFAFLREPGAGVIYDYAVYYITALVSLLGPVEHVSGVVRAPYKTHVNVLPTSPEFGRTMDTPNESQVSAVLRLASGVTGTLHIDADTYMHDRAYFAIYGTKGILYLADPNGFGGEVRFLPAASDFRNPEPPATLWQFTPYSDNSRGVGPAEMAEAIVEGRRNRASKELAYHVQEVLTAILAGGEDGNAVRVESTVRRPEPLEPRKIQALNIGHTAFQMRDTDAMLRFYGETLGMKKLFSMPVDAPERPETTYFKLADRQFLELFHPRGEEPKDAEADSGYMKLNFEVESIAALRERLLAAGTELLEDVHPVVDGSLELAVRDPDGNEVQFTEYALEGTIPPLTGDGRESCSAVRLTTQTAFLVRDAANMAGFYTRGLGLKRAARLTFRDLYDFMAKNGADEASLAQVRVSGDAPWIDYIEVGPRQYIELFYGQGEKKSGTGELWGRVGYQHLCIEVADINEAWDACVKNGLKPDTEIVKGKAGAYQFWLTDPDGNRLELMQYTAGCLQLRE